MGSAMEGRAEPVAIFLSSGPRMATQALRATIADRTATGEAGRDLRPGLRADAGAIAGLDRGKHEGGGKKFPEEIRAAVFEFPPVAGWFGGSVGDHGTL